MKRSWRELKLLDNWMLVKADPRVKKTAGGIHLPDQIVMVERVMEGSGRVLAVGPRVHDILGDDLRVGDRIMFRGFLKDAFNEFQEEDGCKIFLLKAEDALMVLGQDVDVGEFRPGKEKRAS